MLRSLKRCKSRVVSGACAVVGSLLCAGSALAVLSAEETAAIDAVSTKVTELAAGVMPAIGAALAVGIGIVLFVKYVKKIKSAA